MTESREIRQVVFVEEQQVAPEIEYDQYEDTSTHVLARIGNKAVGTARWRKTDQGFKLERFAVLNSTRGKGVGLALVNFVLDQIGDKFKSYLYSQVSAIGFYEKLGFKAEGEIFYEADIPHRKMVYRPESIIRL
jgi:predicted GNAT family N-acyltransferase